MPSFAVQARSLGKAFPVAEGFREFLWPRRADDHRVWAVSEVSLDIPRGGAVAVVGRNGAGKSTLLRLLLGLAGPTRGWVRVNGRSAGLLDLGAGLVGDWTGGENARAALSLAGRKGPSLEMVEEFSGLGVAMSRPVRGYSAGMRLRLAYAVAVALGPEILIADEVIGVGDESFLRRCARFIEDFLRSGGTLVLATHNLYLAEKLCGRALWLDRGVVVADGPCQWVTGLYREHGAAQSLSAGRVSLPVNGLDGGPEVGDREAPDEVEIKPGVPLELFAEVAASSRVLELEVEDGHGRKVAIQRVPARPVYRLGPGALLPGRYRMRLLTREGNRRVVVADRSVTCLGQGRDLGKALLPHCWGGPGFDPPAVS